MDQRAVWLFFLQALRVLCSLLFGVIYEVVFGSLTTAALITLVLAIGAFTTAGGASRRRAREMLQPAASLVVLARAAMWLPDPSTRLAAATAIIAFAGVYLASLLWPPPIWPCKAVWLPWPWSSCCGRPARPMM